MEPGEPLHETQSSKCTKDLDEAKDLNEVKDLDEAKDLDGAKDLDKAKDLERQTNQMVKRPQSRGKNSLAQTNFNNISQWTPKETKTNLAIGTILTKMKPKEMTNKKYIKDPYDFICICRSMVLKLGPSKNPVDLVCNTNQENGTNK